MAVRSKPTPRRPDSPLLKFLQKQIAADGPVPVAAFMDLSLNHPDHGYYQSRDPFGADGDFTTAPEISQVFGELIGLWLAAAWQSAGRPAPFQLVELGPGRGQLMLDLIRATAKVPGFLDAANIHLVETSQRLQAVQKIALDSAPITWHERLDTVPSGHLFLIANEVFDALPTHQLVRNERGWAERLVTWKDQGELAFSLGEAPPVLLEAVQELHASSPGSVTEVSPAREALARAIAERIGRYGGTAAIIDYGAWVDHATGDTLQAVKGHEPVDPLTAPGTVDLTTQVDFRRIGFAASQGGADVFGPVPQGTFLRTLGVEVRTAALLNQANREQGKRLREGLFRLTDASAMGEAFKVLALGSPTESPPPGFVAPSLRSVRR
ncbi:MAG: SAM-dependent methyltransferase [Pseudomonadota bacterium]